LTPYYDCDGITIYHGDCRDVLPTIRGDVVVTDPPYNVGKPYGQHDDSMSPLAYLDLMRGAFSASALAVGDGGLVFTPGTVNVMTCADWLPEAWRVVRMLGWHRKEYAGDLWTSGPAMCWEPVVWASKAGAPYYNRIFGTYGRDFLVVSSVKEDPYRRLHPCPKPYKVMAWLIGLFAPQDGSVVDPFMGSGTALRAAKDLGRKAIGIDIEERNCEIAADRLAQRVLAI
jgi:site-specific DNA-methyltransferase (adenine-specific)